MQVNKSEKVGQSVTSFSL